jgi:hypothetical protein
VVIVVVTAVKFLIVVCVRAVKEISISVLVVTPQLLGSLATADDCELST